MALLGLFLQYVVGIVAIVRVGYEGDKRVDASRPASSPDAANTRNQAGESITNSVNQPCFITANSVLVLAQDKVAPLADRHAHESAGYAVHVDRHGGKGFQLEQVVACGANDKLLKVAAHHPLGNLLQHVCGLSCSGRHVEDVRAGIQSTLHDRGNANAGGFGTTSSTLDYGDLFPAVEHLQCPRQE